MSKRKSRRRAQQRRQQSASAMRPPAPVALPPLPNSPLDDPAAAVALLKQRLRVREDVADMRLLAEAHQQLALREGATDEEHAAHMQAAYAALARLPAPLPFEDFRRLAWAARNAGDWDALSSLADGWLATEICASSCVTKAVSLARSTRYDAFHEPELDEARAWIRRSMLCPDAVARTFLDAAKTTLPEDEAGTAERRIFEAGLDRFPGDSMLALELSTLLEEPEAQLSVLLPAALGAKPSGKVLQRAWKIARDGDPDTALLLLDVMEREAGPWDGFRLARACVQFGRSWYEEAGQLFLAALEAAESPNARYQAYMGLTAVNAESGCPAAACAALAGAFDVAWDEMPGYVSPLGCAPPHELDGDPLYGYELARMDHRVTLRVLHHALAAGARLTDRERDALLAMSVVYADDFADEEGPRLPLLDMEGSVARDSRLLQLHVRALSYYHGKHRRAMELALDASIQLKLRDEPVGSDLVPAYHWPTDLSKSKKPPFHNTALRALRKLMGMDVPEEARQRILREVFLPLYQQRWRAFLEEQAPLTAAEEVVPALQGVLPRRDYLFDQSYFLLAGGSGSAGDAALAEPLLRELVALEGTNVSAASNLGVALSRQRRHLEAAEAYAHASSMSTTDEDRARFAESAAAARRRHEQSLQQSQQRPAPPQPPATPPARQPTSPPARVAPVAVDQEEECEEDANGLFRSEFYRTARERWPSLRFFPRRLLCTLDSISGFESMEQLAEYAGQDPRYIEQHYETLQRTGMIVVRDGTFFVNPHLRDLIERERSHAVVATIVRADRSTAFKPIFNSGREYAFYKALLEFFPNNLVFPNMGLQGIFSYERMQPLLSSEEFAYYLRASVDFCLTSTTTYLPIVAFEVDSAWHDSAAQQRRDEKKDVIFRRGGIDLVRLRPYGEPTEQAIRSDVIRAIREWLTGRELTAGAGVVDPIAELDLSRVGALTGRTLQLS